MRWREYSNGPVTPPATARAGRAVSPRDGRLERLLARSIRRSSGSRCSSSRSPCTSFPTPDRQNFYNHFVWQADAFLHGRVTIAYPVSSGRYQNSYFQDVLPDRPAQGSRTCRSRRCRRSCCCRSWRSSGSTRTARWSRRDRRAQRLALLADARGGRRGARRRGPWHALLRLRHGRLVRRDAGQHMVPRPRRRLDVPLPRHRARRSTPRRSSRRHAAGGRRRRSAASSPAAAGLRGRAALRHGGARAPDDDLRGSVLRRSSAAAASIRRSLVAGIGAVDPGRAPARLQRRHDGRRVPPGL